MQTSVQCRPQERTLGMVMKEVDEDLAMFLEMRRSEKEMNDQLAKCDSEELNQQLGIDILDVFFPALSICSNIFPEIEYKINVVLPFGSSFHPHFNILLLNAWSLILNLEYSQLWLFVVWLWKFSLFFNCCLCIKLAFLLIAGSEVDFSLLSNGTLTKPANQDYLLNSESDKNDYDWYLLL